MRRFVILRHETPPGYDRPTHWDFMLECGRVLRTWALAEPPSPGRAIVAEELADHRLAYLDYEGEVSGGRGAVTRWDTGAYEIVSGRLAPRAEEVETDEPGTKPQSASPLTPALSPKGEPEKRVIHLMLRGGRVTGEVELAPTHQPADAGRSPEDAAAALRYWKFNWKGS